MGQIQQYRPDRMSIRDRLSFMGTLAIAGLNISALGSARLVVPLIALSLGASATLVGVIAAAFTAVPMIFSVSFGRWLDRAGTLMPIMSAALLIVGATLTFWVFPSHYALVVVAGLVGAGAVLTHMAATRAVGSIATEAQRPRYLGYLILSYSLFQLVAPVSAGAMYQHHGSVAAITLLGGFSVLSILAISLRQHHFRHERRGPVERVARQGIYPLLRVPGLMVWILVSSLFFAAQTIFPFVISLHAVANGISPIEAGWLLGAFAGGAFISRFFTPVLTRYARPRPTLVVAMILGAAIYAVIPFAHQVVTLSALSLLLGMPLGVGVPVSLAMIYDTAPAERVNESVGLSMTVNNCLQTIFPLALGALVHTFGVAPMVLAFSLIMLGCAAISSRSSA
ncbi:MFS transporter [Pseudomonas putida]|uniref:MFS transporter n=1 Tax=Pseudomonas putida TaxID=303 RepID=UPI001F526644|nr:MFS transporter [Pseudomonas putida]MCI1025834.1 MFS transporter [Pseudomonas putida]